MKWRAWLQFLLGLSVAVAGLVLLYLEPHMSPVVFEGELWLPREAPERRVVALHDPGQAARMQSRWLRATLSGAFHAAVPLEATNLPASAEDMLSPDVLYDVAELPFDLQFVSSQPLTASQTHDVLRVRQGQQEEDAAITIAMAVPVGDCSATVAAIEPWGGLLRDASGQPMADVSVRLPGQPWVEDLFLAADVWRGVGQEAAVQLQWHDSEDDAAAAVDGAPALRDAARWGVVDGAAVHWLNSFTAGTGMTLGDGRVVTLARRTASPAAIEVNVQEGEGRSSIRVEANAGDPAGLIRFEDWSLLDTAVVIHGWSSRRGLLGVYRNGKLLEAAVLPVGHVYTSTAAPIDLRIDQLEPRAVALAGSESPLFEVHLQSNSDLIRVRQGESAQWCGATVTYLRKTTPGTYAVTVRVGREGRFYDTVLAPDRAVRVGPWKFEAAPGGGPVDAGVTMRASLLASLWVRIAGAVMGLGGAFVSGFGFLRITVRAL